MIVYSLEYILKAIKNATITNVIFLNIADYYTQRLN